MPSKGFYLAQDAHVLPLIFPGSLSGGETGLVFNMAKYAHASILISFGAQAAAATKILLNACTSQAGAGATQIAYDIYTCETSNTDVTSGRTPQTAAGYTPSANPNIFYIIEFDAAQLPQGSNYVQLQMTDGANVDYVAAFAVLSGARYGGDQSATVLV